MGDQLVKNKECVYYNPVTDTVRVFWNYFGEVVEMVEFNIGPYYYIGEL